MLNVNGDYGKRTHNRDVARFCEQDDGARSKVWLYGSRARGDNGPDSDWDLLVLLDRDKVSDADFDRYAYSFMMYGWQHKADVSPQIYTYKEWDKYRITPYHQNVEFDKKVIYGA